MSVTTNKLNKKKLYIRLSSLGDVVMAMSALSVPSESQVSIDWLVAGEFSTLISGHPKVGKVWRFDRKLGFRGWKELGRKLWEEGYDDVYDLHRTHRTRVLRFLFAYWNLTDPKKRSVRCPAWKVISKQRFRLYGYFIFKSLWPKSLRPDSVVSRSARLVGGSGSEKPDARHLLLGSAMESPAMQELLLRLKQKPYVCVMPGSKWAGKKWPVHSFAELLSRMPDFVPVVMGTAADQESAELVSLLEQRGMRVVSAVGKWNLRDVAQILSGAWRYLGNDTGLGHLAEAVGVPSYVIFGPTHEDMGFGPWRRESRAVGKALTCRPCGKDGRFCYRFGQRYACLKSLSADDAMARISEARVEKTAAGKALLVQSYARLMRTVFQGLLVPRFASEQRVSEGRKQWDRFIENPRAQSAAEMGQKRIWWHAASVGELEILWPAMIRMAERGRDNRLQTLEFAITILSESAKERLEKLVQQLESLGVKPVFAGFSPWEGDWKRALETIRPDLFVTSKYEAWPELWMSLGELGIPLSIVSAKARRSLRICQTICKILGARLPQMLLLTAIEEDAQELKDAFPDADVQFAGEPRWDQVWNRAQAGNKRAQEIASALSMLPRPWGVLGSAWQEDVLLWKKNLQQKTCGTVLIVPHRIDSEHLHEIEEVLRKAGIRYLKTAEYASVESFRAALESHSEPSDFKCIVVNEMGFLSELYSVADWAYVGGGIGRRGVHSTIEPAIHGIPISCGHYRSHQFVEISALSATGQLTLVRTENDLRAWLDGLKGFPQRDRWRGEARRRLGATETIVQRMVGILSSGVLS